MKYIGAATDPLDSSRKIGVLLVNLGTPERATTPALRRYLGEFLLDPRVIEIPKLFRLLLVRGIIINFRAHKSAAAYRKIWTKMGSPLMTNSVALANRTATLLGEERFSLKLAMRYGKPDIEEKLLELHKEGIHEIVVIPLYPQYSGSTNGSTFDALAKAMSQFRWVPKLHFVESYYQRSDYITAIANSITQHWQKNGKAQKLLMSFHGLPQQYITAGDPYQVQCTETARTLATVLDLCEDEWMLVFQSRLGAQAWIRPYCDEVLRSLPTQGIKSVDIICPGFSADCLETLEEIDSEKREIFIQSGGENFAYIRCLNDSQPHAELVANIVRDTVAT